MTYFTGLDVLLEETAICVVDMILPFKVVRSEV